MTTLDNFFEGSFENVDPFKLIQVRARSSSVSFRYDLIPLCALERIQARYALGAQKYGDYSYRKGIDDPLFVQDRINHMLGHLFNYLQGKSDVEKDDDLAAAAWGLLMLMEFEADSLGKETIRKTLKHINGF